MLQGALPRSPWHTGLPHLHLGGSSPQLSMGSPDPWAWPGDAPCRQGLQKGVEGLSSITSEKAERFGKMLAGELSLEATGPGDCQPRAHASLDWLLSSSSWWGQEGHSQPPTKHSCSPCPGLAPSAFHPSPRDLRPCSAREAEPSSPFPPPSPASALKRSSPSPSPPHCFPGNAPPARGV